MKERSWVTPALLCNVLETLFKTGQSQTAEFILASHTEVKDTLLVTSEGQINLSLMETMIKCYSKHGEVEKAMKIYEESKQMITTTYVLNSLLEALIKKEMIDQATKILDEHTNIQPQVVDSTTFGTFGKALIF